MSWLDPLHQHLLDPFEPGPPPNPDAPEPTTALEAMEGFLGMLGALSWLRVDLVLVEDTLRAILRPALRWDAASSTPVEHFLKDALGPPTRFQRYATSVVLHSNLYLDIREAFLALDRNWTPFRNHHGTLLVDPPTRRDCLSRFLRGERRVQIVATVPQRPLTEHTGIADFAGTRVAYSMGTVHRQLVDVQMERLGDHLGPEPHAIATLREWLAQRGAGTG